MEETTLQPTTIMKHNQDAYPAFAMIAGLELGVFTGLSNVACTSEELAKKLGVNSFKLQHLLYALAEAELLAVDDEGRFTNSDEADAFLVGGRPTYMVPTLFRMNYVAMLQTAMSVRSGRPQYRWMSLSAEQKRGWLDGLRSGARAMAAQLTQLYDFSRYRTIADVAGGAGEFAIAIAALCPNLRATVIEMPDIVPMARDFIAGANASDRVNAVDGDVLTGELSGTYDAVAIRNFLQTLSPEEARTALSNVHDIVAPGGDIFLGELTLDDSRLGPVGAVRLGLLLVNLFDSSTAYTESEYKGFLTDAGFVDFERRPSASGFSILRAKRPE